MLRDNEILTGVVRLSYANIWEPRAPMNGGKPVYSASLIISKDDDKTLRAIKAKIKAMMTNAKVIEKVGGSANIHSKRLRIPLRDGDADRPGDEAYSNSYFINVKASETQRPKIFDRHGNEIIDKAEVYSGCYVRAIIQFYGYNRSGNFGIGAGLVALQKWKDGDALGGVSVSASDFDDGFSDGSSADESADDDIW